MKHLNDCNKGELNGYTKVCSLSELQNKAGKRFFINEVEIAVFKIGEEVYALSNICPHQHTALIYDGFLEGGFVVCPAHGWKFNLKTGAQPSGSNGLDVYPVLIDNDEVYVKAAKKNFYW